MHKNLSKYLIKFIDNLRFMQTPVSNLTYNLSRKLHKKCVLNVQTNIEIVNIALLKKCKVKNCNNKTNMCMESVNVMIKII